MTTWIVVFLIMVIVVTPAAGSVGKKIGQERTATLKLLLDYWSSCYGRLVGGQVSCRVFHPTRGLSVGFANISPDFKVRLSLFRIKVIDKNEVSCSYSYRHLGRVTQWLHDQAVGKQAMLDRPPLIITVSPE